MRNRRRNDRRNIIDRICDIDELLFDDLVILSDERRTELEAEKEELLSYL